MNPKDKLQKGHSLLLLKLFLIGMIIVIILIGFVSQTINLGFTNGFFVRIYPASIWGSAIWPSKCLLTFQPKNAEEQTVIFWQGIDIKPTILIPSSGGRTFFCLYDSDTDMSLFKIDPTKAFKPFSSTQWTPLRAVRSSTCLIEEASAKDHQEALEYMNGMSSDAFKHEAIPRYNIGFLRFGLSLESKSNLMHRLETSNLAK